MECVDCDYVRTHHSESACSACERAASERLSNLASCLRWAGALCHAHRLGFIDGADAGSVFRNMIAPVMPWKPGCGRSAP